MKIHQNLKIIFLNFRKIFFLNLIALTAAVDVMKCLFVLGSHSHVECRLLASKEQGRVYDVL